MVARTTQDSQDSLQCFYSSIRPRLFLHVAHCALTTEQVEQYGPPPNPAKITDPRAKWYIQKHGKTSWELDAIDALELRRIAEDNVLDYIDMDKYNEWIELENKDKKKLTTYGKTL